MNIFSKFLFAGLALLLCASSASAAVYNWSFVSGELTANGTFSTGGPGVGLNGPGFDIVSVTGTSNLGAITGLLPPGSCCGTPYNNNNIFYPSGLPYVDAAGFAYSDAAGDSVEIWKGPIWYEFSIETPAGALTDRGGLTISPVPEPRTYAMWLAGLGLIGFVVYHRRNDSSNMAVAAIA